MSSSPTSREPAIPAGPVRLALLQSRASEDPVENTNRSEAVIRKAAAAGAEVLILQELFRSRYFCQRQEATHFDLAEPIDGATVTRLRDLAAELAVVLVAPVFERRAAGVFHNSALVIDADGQVAGHYRKMHIPQDPGFEEKYYFTPGDRGFVAPLTRHGRIGALICWDQWFPEAARATALRGAWLLTYPTAIGWLPGEKDADGRAWLDAWATMQRAHAIANGVYVAAVNRVGFEAAGDGTEAGIEFWGSSFVCDPMGRILAQASESESELLLVDCDPSTCEPTRRDWPFLRDRRLDAYSDLQRRSIDEGS